MKVIKVICLCAEQGKDLDDFFQSTAGTFISLLFSSLWCVFGVSFEKKWIEVKHLLYKHLRKKLVKLLFSKTASAAFYPF